MPTASLHDRLPALRKWIETIVETHRPAARPVASLGFPRLGHYFSADFLNLTLLVEVEHVAKPPLSALGLHQFADFEQVNSAAITYLDLCLVDRNRVADEALLFHELVHAVQWQVLGTERFILAYALGHISGRGYEGNPFEVIARQLESRFVHQASTFRVEPIVKQHLDQVAPTLLSAADALLRRP
ncbi:hypothetical protein [Steroidobacter sp.]|uniref:hypothetical protein n=1 Tax=Steroidobacter sp. TaxID=1978227 RepID=UPI001A57C158|nr:hypothetical protein [Steroidobacter sp.]MBL8265133.1 hypothetical protein [Steroidobacter sp.]